jgi:hypothetical protein
MGHTGVVQQLLAAPGININAADKVIGLREHWPFPLLLRGKN